MQIKTMWFVLYLVAAYAGGLGTVVMIHKPSTEGTIAATMNCPPAAIAAERLVDNFKNGRVQHGQSKGY